MLITLGVIAGLLLVVLLAPVRVDVDLDTTRPAHRVRVRVRWLVVSWRSDRPRKPRREKPPEPPRAPKALTYRARRRVRRLRSAWAALRSPGFVARSVRLVRDLLRVILPDELRLHVRAGLDDPASTGELYGAMCALTAWRQPGRWDVRFEPDFDGASLSGAGAGSWRVRPGALLWPVATFAAAPAVWRAAWAAWRAPRS
jgi:hypothetical protein